MTIKLLGESMSNRWDDARSQRGLDKLPIQTVYEYIGRLEIDFDQIYADFKDHTGFARADWNTWNSVDRDRQAQTPFPVNESTKYVSTDQVHFSELRVREPYEAFEKIFKDLGLYLPEGETYVPIKIHRQMPGDMLWMHYDFYDHRESPETWKKYLIFLNDWAPGQVSLWGEDAIVGWKSGDRYDIDALVTPHSAVNCGPEERWALQISGKKIT